MARHHSRSRSLTISCVPRQGCVYHKMVNATRHRIGVGAGTAEGAPQGEVYGMWFDPGFGYHVDFTKGIATGNQPESIYAVMSGKNYNGGCCFE